MSSHLPALSVCRFESMCDLYTPVYLYMSSRLPALSVCRYESTYYQYSGLIHLYTCICPLIYLHCLCAGMSQRTTNTVGRHHCVSSTCGWRTRVSIHAEPSTRPARRPLQHSYFSKVCTSYTCYYYYCYYYYTSLAASFPGQTG